MAKEKRIGVGVGVMILSGNKILLGLRNSDAEKADSELHGEGTWTMPGGKMHFGESFEEACYREVAEETGIKVSKSDLTLISISNDKTLDAHFVTLGFLCRKYTGEPKVMEPEEIVDWRWFDLTDLPKNIFIPSANVIKQYNLSEIYEG